MKKIIGILSAFAIVLLSAIVSSCSRKMAPTPSYPSHFAFNLALVENAPSNRYIANDYGIRLNVSDGRSDTRLLNKYDASATYLPSSSANPEVVSFVSESTRRYMRTMGFNLDSDVATDYMMTLSITEFHVGYLSGVGWSGTVRMNVAVYDSNRRLVYPNVAVTGRSNLGGSSDNFTIATRALNTAYANALKDIDWDRIAFFLKKAATPALESNKQVSGMGNTSLESTVIRWYIDSTPRGADVSTRVVSSTSDVKNTNQNYVGSTPYETTETFDIRGLTFNNSGDVQIEITCEKAGYITQKRRFNLRQVIEQKEISTKFNLVKED